MNKLMELVDLHADAVCNALEGRKNSTSGKSWLTIRDECYAEIQVIADENEKKIKDLEDVIMYLWKRLFKEEV